MKISKYTLISIIFIALNSLALFIPLFIYSYLPVGWNPIRFAIWHLIFIAIFIYSLFKNESWKKLIKYSATFGALCIVGVVTVIILYGGYGNLHVGKACRENNSRIFKNEEGGFIPVNNVISSPPYLYGVEASNNFRCNKFDIRYMNEWKECEIECVY